jgi:predicted nucleic acid-binding protein
LKRGDFLDLAMLSNAFPSASFLAAAEIYRMGRMKGYPIRSSADCLIAAIAIDSGVPVWPRIGTLTPSRDIQASVPSA